MDVDLKCIICASNGSYFFSKKYTEYPFNEFMLNIGSVNYFKCESCGFVWSQTHRKLKSDVWNELNHAFHHYLELNEEKNEIKQPPYVEQAMMLMILGRNGLISIDDVLDYAAGYGALRDILFKYYDTKINIFDKYITPRKCGFSENQLERRKYKTVINSAMFEHVLTRADLDVVNSLISADGCLILHTVVCERVPNDPNWFYLRPPVHTAFHTNSSMEVLMGQWGFRSSIYCPQAKCWILLRSDHDDVRILIDRINNSLKSKWFFAKSGFVDYWKGY